MKKSYCEVSHFKASLTLHRLLNFRMKMTLMGSMTQIEYLEAKVRYFDTHAHINRNSNECIYY